VDGYVDNRLALWQLSPLAAVRIRDIPQVAANPGSLIPAPLTFGAVIIEVASDGPDVVVLAGEHHQWTLARGPVGRPAASALAGGWLYVISARAASQATLWRSPVHDLR
jgi:hypothetical protein